MQPCPFHFLQQVAQLGDNVVFPNSAGQRVSSKKNWRYGNQAYMGSSCIHVVSSLIIPWLSFTHWAIIPLSLPCPRSNILPYFSWHVHHKVRSIFLPCPHFKLVIVILVLSLDVVASGNPVHLWYPVRQACKHLCSSKFLLLDYWMFGLDKHLATIQRELDNTINLLLTCFLTWRWRTCSSEWKITVTDCVRWASRPFTLARFLLVSRKLLLVCVTSMAVPGYGIRHCGGQIQRWCSGIKGRHESRRRDRRKWPLPVVLDKYSTNQQWRIWFLQITCTWTWAKKEIYSHQDSNVQVVLPLHHEYWDKLFLTGSITLLLYNQLSIQRLPCDNFTPPLSSFLTLHTLSLHT